MYNLKNIYIYLYVYIVIYINNPTTTEAAGNNERTQAPPSAFRDPHQHDNILLSLN